MKIVLNLIAVSVLSLGSLVTSNAEAGEPKATLCRMSAVEAASALFNLNVKPVSAVTHETDLIDLNHAEGGTEVWDVKFKTAGVEYSAYRMTLEIDACTTIAFEMPYAN